jgi:hypothetical protein
VRVYMNLLKSFLLGALVGDALFVFFALLDRFHPSTMGIGAWADRTVFKVCPFWGFGFSNDVKSWTALIALALISNAIIYGGLGALCFSVVKLIRWTIGK